MNKPPTEVLVLAVHGSPGDPARARREFAFLEQPDRPLEVLILSGDKPVSAQLEHIALERYPLSEITLAPLLLAAGYHLQHDLLPAVQALEERGRSVNLLPLWGRSASFKRAIKDALGRLARSRTPSGILWLAPGGAAVMAALRRQVDEAGLLPESLTQHWATRLDDDLPRDALPVIAVLREGRLSRSVRKAWTGSRAPRLLFSRPLLQEALRRWTVRPRRYALESLFVATMRR